VKQDDGEQSKLMRIPTRGLAYRLALYIAATMAVFLGLSGYWVVRESRSHLEQTVVDSSDRVSDVIRRSTRSFMLRNERQPTYEIIQAIGEQPSMDRIRVYDKEGRIRYSTSSEEIDHRVNMRAEACISCHHGDVPSPVIHREQRYRIFRAQDGHRILGMITPIQNEPACSDAGCHVHPPTQIVLGVLDVQMSLAKVDEDLRGLTWQLAASIAVALLGLIIFCTLILYHLVHRPVRQLIHGTKLVAAGDLEARIPARSHDELLELAESFNHMTVELADARAQADAWARTLEDRVEEKSQQLERVQEEIVQMERMASMGKLAAIVAHELNNPLAGIRTYARLLVKRALKKTALPAEDSGIPNAGVPGTTQLSQSTSSGGSTDESIEMLSQIEAESARCGEIVKNLLQFSRPSRPRLEPCDVNELVSGGARLVQHQIDLQGIEKVIDLAPGLKPIICDPQQIRQALVAVLINACEAMPQEGTITIATRPDGDDGISIMIGDTGIGMDEETRWHVFEPFYTTKEGGAGLGLAVVYGIIRNHGGRVEVQSAPGRGTEIRFYLPAKPPEPLGDRDSDLSGIPIGDGMRTTR
jgi:two-component system, NtrC family, sensor kinase